MKIFGHYFFEDPEEDGFKKEWEEKRKQRVIEQCQHYGTKDEHVFWDLVEMPRVVADATWESKTKEDMKLHDYLMKKQECHVFYGKKYCYHTSDGEVITDIV